MLIIAGLSCAVLIDAGLSCAVLIVAGLSCAVLGIGLVVRSFVAFAAVQCTELNFKERLFIVGAWLPKATVQVRINKRPCVIRVRNVVRYCPW